MNSTYLCPPTYALISVSSSDSQPALIWWEKRQRQWQMLWVRGLSWNIIKETYVVLFRILRFPESVQCSKNEGPLLICSVFPPCWKMDMRVCKLVGHMCMSVCVCAVRKLCLLASPSFSQMPYARLFLLALKETRAGWKCVSLLYPQAYFSG